MNSKQEDLFKTPSPAIGSLLVTIELRGLGAVPSFKTGKLAFGWMDTKTAVVATFNGELWVRKRGMRIMARPLTKPEHQAWMKVASSRIESQLRSALATTGVAIQTAASPRSLIATLLPLDDCWTSFRELRIKSELCAPGEEGATITIERL